jgi:hypothetical protein
MKKLKLRLESLDVESFAAETEERARGTAMAFNAAVACSPAQPCEPTGDDAVYTCDGVCDPTVWQTS